MPQHRSLKDERNGDRKIVGINRNLLRLYNYTFDGESSQREVNIIFRQYRQNN